ncbi:LuxR family transcriptional regulator [Streptomyces violaceusniger]|uniref:LuxR family transcriptional regulator n=2 Tax=Streptomyces violaceusniger TaxID=68280 RepID=A0A4D4L051_STRVO|nr:LuxR family transcriptional regulator [Streptomyces violaceusniger]
MRDEDSMVLLERETALAKVAAALRQARHGRGSLLVVQGPLGTGKTSFLEALARLARDEGVGILRAQGCAAEEGLTFGVLRQLVDSGRCDVTAEPTKARATTAMLARTEAEPSGPGREVSRTAPEHMPNALASILDAVPPDKALLVLVDDLHFADTESLRTLAWELTQSHDRRLLCVFSILSGDARADQPPIKGLIGMADRTAVLSALGPSGAYALITDAFGMAAEQGFVSTLRERSGGNPLVLRSLIDEVRIRRVSPTAENTGIVRALRPDYLRRRLAAFLRSQPAHLRRTVNALAVLGRIVDPQVAARLAGLDALRYAEAVHALGLLGLLDEQSTVRAGGTLLWESLVDSIPTAELTAMRSMAAELLHQAGHPAEVAAEQLMPAPTLNNPKGVRILRNAADSALRRGAPRDAARYLRQALLDSSSVGAVRTGLLIDLASAERSFAATSAQRHVAEALPLLHTARDRAAAVVQLGPLLMEPAEFAIDSLMRDVADDLEASGSDDAPTMELALRLEAHRHALADHNPSHTSEAMRRFKQLGESPPLRTAGQRELLASLAHIAFVTNGASADQLAALCTRLLEREPPRPEHVHTTLPLAVNVLAATGRTVGVSDWLRQARHQGGDVERAIIRAEQAMLALASGNVADAKQEMLRADVLAGPEVSGLPALCTAIFAIVALHSDEPELADEFITLHRLSDTHQYLAALLHMARGLLAARHREDRRALNHFRTAGQRMERIGWLNPTLLPWSSCVALMHHRLGEYEQALTAARLEVDRARTWGAPAVVGHALVALGRVTPGRKGAELLEEAVSLLERSTNSHELCRALYILGCHAETDRTRSTRLLKRAYDLGVQCGADWMVQKITAKLQTARASTRTAHPRLTRSELRVAQLAAEGHSNTEISKELGISSRMTEKHLTQCYRKLGIPGRRGLSAALDKQFGQQAESHEAQTGE